MNGSELPSTLKEMGWSQAELGRRLGVSDDGVSKWRTGKRPVPRYVAEYLRVMLLAKRMLDA